MAGDSETLDILIRTRNGRQAAGEIRGVSDETKRLSSATDAQARSADRAAASSGRLSSAWSSAVQMAKRGAIVFGGMAVAGGIAGVRLNASMEQNTVAFGNFLGSQKAARQELEWLEKFAARSPFEFPDLVSADRKLLAFGMTAKQSRRVLGSIGEASAGLGLAGPEIDRMTMAIGQIQAKGKLSTEELLQMAELGVPAFKILKKELGLTGKELEDGLRKGAISADTGIAALTRGMDRSFKGSMEGQSKTFSGQVSTLKDGFNSLLRTASKPLFDFLSTKVLPVMVRITDAANKGFQAGGITGMVAGIDKAVGAGGKLSSMLAGVRSALPWIAEQGRAVGSAIKSWVANDGPAKSFAALKEAAGPLGPVIRGIMSALQNPTVQKVLVSVVALGASFKVLNKASGGAAGAIAKFSLGGMQLTTAIVGLVANLVAYRTATMASTAAENADTIAKTRSTAATVANGVATRATSAAVTLWTGAQWLLNAALTANPIGLVVAGLAALAAGFALAYSKVEWFRNGVNAVLGFVKKNWPTILAVLTGPIGLATLAIVRNWDKIKSGASAVFGTVRSAFNKIVGFFSGIGGRIASATKGMWDGITSSFKGAINWIIRKWNGLHFGMKAKKIAGKTVVPGFDIGTPDIPLLADGGTILQRGSVIVGEEGPEMLDLPQGASVRPLDQGGGGVTRVITQLIDGRVLADVVYDQASTAAARA